MAQLAGRVEQRAAQVLQHPQAVAGHGQAAPAAPWLAERAGFGLVFGLGVVPALAIPLAWPIARTVGDRERGLAGPIAALVVITASGGAQQATAMSIIALGAA